MGDAGEVRATDDGEDKTAAIARDSVNAAGQKGASGSIVPHPIFVPSPDQIFPPHQYQPRMQP